MKPLLPFWTKPLLALLGTLFLSGLAQLTIDIPGTTIELTGQTFGVVMIGMTLGKWWGALSLALYLIAGAVGLPVFADGSAGASKLWGYTAGFLWGFLVTAWFVGYWVERIERQTILMHLIIWLIGHFLIVLMGSMYLVYLKVAAGDVGLVDASVSLVTELWVSLLPGWLIKSWLGALLTWWLSRIRPLPLTA